MVYLCTLTTLNFFTFAMCTVPTFITCGCDVAQAGKCAVNVSSECQGKTYFS